MNKNNISLINKELKNNTKMVAMIAPSFAAEFDYPNIIYQLKEFGFSKVVELTFGAKMINREYHKILESNKESKKLIISSVCPGIVEIIKAKYPNFKKNIIPVDSPMIATAKICKKTFPKYKTVFISPCNFKKIEADKSEYVDFVIDYEQLRNIIYKNKIKNITKNKIIKLDKFYNDYTKIYPISGGLSKTAHLRGAINKNEVKIIDGISDVKKFLNNPKKEIRFLDITFCKGGCIGGPHLSKSITLNERKKRMIKYANLAKKEDIPNQDLGIIKKAQGINFTDTKI